MQQFTDTDPYQLIWIVRRLFRALAQASDASLRDLGITAADRAVLEFLFPDQRLSVPDIARQYSVSRQHVQVTINALLDQRLVKASTNPSHKRSPLMSLTARGKKLFSSVLERDQTTIEALFTTIATSDVRTTRKTLQQLLQNVEEAFEP